MDAVEFIEERKRMCKAQGILCSGCPARVGSDCSVRTQSPLDANEQVKIVEAWSAAHPRKTRQSVFLEQWPDVQLDKDGNIALCPKLLCKGEELNALIAMCHGSNCASCLYRFWSKVVK